MTVFNAAITRAATMLAQVEKPGRELLGPARCAELGYSMCLHGLTLLSAAVQAQEQALQQLSNGVPPVPASEGGILSDFEHLYSVAGFDNLEELEKRFPS